MSSNEKEIDPPPTNKTLTELPVELINEQKKNLFKYLLDHSKNCLEDFTLPNKEFEIRPSKLKGSGNGLFTNIDIPMAHIIMLYPPLYIQELADARNIWYKGDKIPIDQVSMKLLKELIESDYSLTFEDYRVVADPSHLNNQVY